MPADPQIQYRAIELDCTSQVVDINIGRGCRIQTTALTMRVERRAGALSLKKKLIYPNHRTPSLAHQKLHSNARDRSNRLLGHDIGVNAIILRATGDSELSIQIIHHHQIASFNAELFSQPGLNGDPQAIALDNSNTFRQCREDVAPSLKRNKNHQVVTQPFHWAFKRD